MTHDEHVTVQWTTDPKGPKLEFRNRRDAARAIMGAMMFFAATVKHPDKEQIAQLTHLFASLTKFDKTQRSDALKVETLSAEVIKKLREVPEE